MRRAVTCGGGGRKLLAFLLVVVLVTLLSLTLGVQARPVKQDGVAKKVKEVDSKEKLEEGGGGEEEKEKEKEEEEAKERRKAIFETPYLCRLGKRYPWIRTFVDERLPLYMHHVEWRETGGNPRLIVFDDDMGIKSLVHFKDEHRDVESILKVLHFLPPLYPLPSTLYPSSSKSASVVLNLANLKPPLTCRKSSSFDTGRA